MFQVLLLHAQAIILDLYYACFARNVGTERDVDTLGGVFYRVVYYGREYVAQVEAVGSDIPILLYLYPQRDLLFAT